MSTRHSKAAKQFLKNGEKAQWQDNTLWGVRVKRDRMAKGLDEWESLRNAASLSQLNLLLPALHLPVKPIPRCLSFQRVVSSWAEGVWGPLGPGAGVPPVASSAPTG